MTILSYHTILDMETMASDKPIASIVGELKPKLNWSNTKVF